MKFKEITGKEVMIAERKAGASIASMSDPDSPHTMKLMFAFGWVIKKRENISLTFDDYLSNTSYAQIEKEIEIGEDEQETNEDETIDAEDESFVIDTDEQPFEIAEDE